MYLTLFSSKLAEKKLRRPLKENELIILNYLASKDQGPRKEALPAESAVMCDLVRARTTDYKSILDLFCFAKIIRHKSGFVFDQVDRAGNRCRRILLDQGILQEVKSQKVKVLKKINLKKESFDFKDVSEVKDKETRAVLENLGRMTLDYAALERAQIGIESLVIVRKFLAGIRNVKKSPRTGRISHLLLHAGSKAVRPFFRIEGECPVDIDGKSFHWQLVAEELDSADRDTLLDMVNTGFYESIMLGTGIEDRDVIKRKSQQVLTNKRLGKQACAIRTWLFEMLPSLKTYCQSIWAKGTTVQATLQTIEAKYINKIVSDFADRGLWIVPFYDGIWVRQQDLETLFDAAKDYIFVQKA
jgi:hypothetical protein